MIVCVFIEYTDNFIVWKRKNALKKMVLCVIISLDTVFSFVKKYKQREGRKAFIDIMNFVRYIDE